MSSAEPSSQPSAQPSEKSAHPAIRSEQRWSQAKARAPPTTTTAASSLQKNWPAQAQASPEPHMSEPFKSGTPDFSNWSCPLPLVGYPTIVMGHGGGGKLGNELVEHLFVPAFRNAALENLGDAAVLDLRAEGDRAAARIAMSTDSFVVQPLFFPGGSIGALAVNGTVNDLAVSGAVPKFLTAGFILEEGFPLAPLA